MAPYAKEVGAIAVDAVLSVAQVAEASGNTHSVDLRDIRIIKRPGGTIDDMRLLENCIALNQTTASLRGTNTAMSAPTRIEKARIGLIQFQLSPPKTDMDSQIIVQDYAQMDRILREERTYIQNILKRIKKTGCNVLLVQKSILRDALSELAIHYLAKLKIMVIPEIERDEVDFLCRALGCKPIADIEGFSEDKLASADLVEESDLDGTTTEPVVLIHLPPKKQVTSKGCCSILVRGANSLVAEEAERSLHDALCVVRCLVKCPAMIAGGGFGEAALARLIPKALEDKGTNGLSGVEAHCLNAYAQAFEAIPTILAENAGLSPISILTAMRSQFNHPLCTNGPSKMKIYNGINVRRGEVSDMVAERVLQPLLVNLSTVQLATETCAMILKIDDMVQSR